MDSNRNVKKPIQELWQDYHFLTKEMADFLDRQDIDFFMELMEQRENLQHIIDSANSGEFIASAEGKALFYSIQRVNQSMMHKLQYQFNISRKQHTVSKAYDNLGMESAGSRMEWHT